MIMVHRDSSVIEACELMRRFRTNRLLVIEVDDGTPISLGTVSAEDVVTRVVALGLDPGVLTAGDVASFGRSCRSTTTRQAPRS